MTLIKMLLINAVMVHIAISTWTTFFSTTFSKPANIYKFNCNSNDVITGNLNWGDASNLDIWIYFSGSNLLSNTTTYAKFQTISSYNQQFNFTVNNSGVYYFRIIPVNVISTVLMYSLTIVNLNVSSNLTVNSYLFRNYDAIAISFYNPMGITAGMYNITNGQQLILMLYSTQTNQSYFPSPNSLFCLPTQSPSAEWVIAIINNSTQALDLSLATIDVFYDTNLFLCDSCPTGYMRNNITTQCQININTGSQSSSSSTTPNTSQNTQNSQTLSAGIIGGIVGGIVFLIILIIVIIILYKKRIICRNRNQRNIDSQEREFQNNPYIKRVPEINNVAIIRLNMQASNQNINIDTLTACPICLKKKCDKILKCKHQFHKTCIQNWQKKQPKCPLCNNKFSIRSMIKKYQQRK